MSNQGNDSLHREWAEARRASRSGMSGPCAQGEVTTGRWGQPERAHEVGLIIDPVVILLGESGG